MFPNLLWAVREAGAQFRLAAKLGESESWLSRRLTGRVEFTHEDRTRIAVALGYPESWLFATPNPPSRTLSEDHELTGAAA